MLMEWSASADISIPLASVIVLGEAGCILLHRGPVVFLSKYLIGQ